MNQQLIEKNKFICINFEVEEPYNLFGLSVAQSPLPLETAQYFLLGTHPTVATFCLNYRIMSLSGKCAIFSPH